MSLTDSGGDGWQGATWSLVDQHTGDVVASGTLDDGSSGSLHLCLADGDYTVVVGGGDADSEIGVEIDGSVDGEIDADAGEDGLGGATNGGGDFTASGGEVILPRRVAGEQLRKRPGCK